MPGYIPPRVAEEHASRCLTCSLNQYSPNHYGLRGETFCEILWVDLAAVSHGDKGTYDSMLQQMSRPISGERRRRGTESPGSRFSCQCRCKPRRCRDFASSMSYCRSPGLLQSPGPPRTAPHPRMQIGCSLDMPTQLGWLGRQNTASIAKCIH